VGFRFGADAGEVGLRLGADAIVVDLALGADALNLARAAQLFGLAGLGPARLFALARLRGNAEGLANASCTCNVHMVRGLGMARASTCMLNPTAASARVLLQCTRVVWLQLRAAQRELQVRRDAAADSEANSERARREQGPPPMHS
jgi:hypothetical protein